MGSFRLAAGRLHLHKHFNFAESQEETVWPSLRHSCRSELTRQGISLPWDRYSYGRRLLGLRSRACTPSRNLPAPGSRHTLYVHFRVCRVLCFYYTVAATISLQPHRPSSARLYNLPGHTFSRSYGVNLPSFFSCVLSSALEFSSCPPVSLS